MRSIVSYALAGVIALAAGSAFAQGAGGGSGGGGSGSIGATAGNTAAGNTATGGNAGVGSTPATSGATGMEGSASSREINRDYSDMLRKGKGAETMRRERVVEQAPAMRSTVVALEDQFPEQGSDNPSGLLSNGDWRDDNRGPETAIGRGNPITLDNQVGQLDPQEPAPLFRRGPIVRTQ